LTFAIYPSLAGRNVFNSGSATGIGAELVRAFAGNHARVVFVDVQCPEGEALAAAVEGEGGTALFLNCDVTDVVALQAAIAEARAELGPIAFLVNDAANDERHAVADVTQGRKLNAVLEPGALEGRHVQFLRPEWWRFYPPKTASALAACLAAARVNRLPDDADFRTPWERGDDRAIADYELTMIHRSASNMRAIGLGA
jgi:NAD(P)-dependent dehydrogenase (short-subunit alcohol dehydrogenase family)